MKRTLALSALLAGLSLLGGWALASDQKVLGKSFVVKNRKLTSSAKELNSPNTITGDPTRSGSAGGAILTIIAKGTNPSAQDFNLPQGVSSSHKPFWRASGTFGGFKYKDGSGDQGPVRTVIIKKSLSGVFTVKVVIRGKNGMVNVVPPDAGTSGLVTLKIGGGDRYCLQFTDGQMKNVKASLFKVRHPITAGCSSVSGAFLG
jgi:hypothetical protein